MTTRENSILNPGFTLIELLVVICVVGILAGLLAPALSQARLSAYSTKCLSNFRQIGVAIQLYADDHEYLPPGRIAGYAQWDSCLNPYIGSHGGRISFEPRSTLFMCPSARIRNNGVRLNYSANPNVCKDIKEGVNQVKPSELRRPTEIIEVADSVQYTANGDSHAMFWGVQGNSGREIYWNDGKEEDGDAVIQSSTDTDGVWNEDDASAAVLRYRHQRKQVNALFGDGHVEARRKDRVLERNVYTNY